MRKRTLLNKVLMVVSATVMSLTTILSPLSGTGVTAEAAVIGADFLKTNGRELRNNYGNGDTVYLRGTNAGGYLVQEFWMTPTDYSDGVTCEKDIYETLTSRFGEKKMRDLIDVYQDNYWTEADFDNCKNLGINCIRLPFWYMNFVDFNGNYIDGCFDRIDWFIQEAGERGIYVILDFHGAPGSQNGSDHSGVDGGDNKEGASEFFYGGNAYNNQQLYYDIWYKIAQRYAGNPTVAGYDLLNEPYCTYRYNSSHSEEELRNTLWSIYDIAYDVIRSADPDHVIIMEATWDAWDLPNPSDYGWTNVMYEYHNYLYDDYDNENGQQIASMQNKINGINAMNYNVPSYMGEFSYFNNISAWQQGLQLFNAAGLNWTSWTYKVTGTDNNWGLYNLEVPKVNVSTDSYDEIYDKWSKVGNSVPNTKLLDGIKGYFSGTVGYTPTSLSDGAYYLVGTHSGKVVCGDNFGNDPLVANRDSYGGAWETFSVVNNSDGTISLKCGTNDKYVCAVIDEETQLIPRSTAIEDWEKFYLVRVSDTEYALRAKGNGKYVCVDENNGNVLYASRDSISGWEAFRIYDTSGTQMKPGSIANDSDKNESDQNDSDKNESDQNDSDTNDSDKNESDTNDSDKNESDNQESSDSVTSDYGLKDNVQDGVILHAWEWSFNNIKDKMPEIANAGYTAVQTSVIQQAKEPTIGRTNDVWWLFYQPACFAIDNTGQSALGTKDEFIAMCEEAHKYGIKVIVDVVANHLGNQKGYDLSEAIPSDIREDASCWHENGFEEIGNYNDRDRVTQMSMGGLPDLNTGNDKIQNYVLDYLKECIDAGADGFRFDAAKHIETPDDNVASDFWPTIIDGAKEYYKSNGYYKDRMNLYCYGEILNESTVSDITSYTDYMSITENQTGNNVRNAVAGGNASGAVASSYLKGETADKAVLWAESHDTYSNESKESTNISDADINKTWALVGTRSDASALYFARTDGYRGGNIGEIYSTQCFSKEVTEVNKFHNYFAGQPELLSSEGSIAYNERGTTGVVLVNCSGNTTDVNVTAHRMSDGSYVDKISGNTFTVSDGKISGRIGDTGIAVVYSDAQAEKFPTVTLSHAGGEFDTDTLKLTLKLYNATSGTYQINDEPINTFTDSATITIGSDMNYGDSLLLKLTATDGEKVSETFEYRFKKVEKLVNTVYLALPSGWSEPVYCYAYDDSTEVNNAQWPGIQMTKDSATGYYYYEIPENIETPRVIFYSSDTNRTPDNMEPGYLLTTKGNWLYKDGTWAVYDKSQSSAMDASVEGIINAISKLNNITLESEATITKIRKNYDALTTEQKDAVSNYDVLLAAEERLKQLIAEKEENGTGSADKDGTGSDNPAKDESNTDDPNKDENASDNTTKDESDKNQTNSDNTTKDESDKNQTNSDNTTKDESDKNQTNSDNTTKDESNTDNPNKDNTPNTNIDQETNNTNTPETQTPTPNTDTDIKVGTTFEYNGLYYKITNADDTNNTVILTKGSKKTIKKLVIPKTVKYKDKTYKVTAISDKAFANYQKLTSVVIEKNVTQIGNNAFKGCKQLKTITIKSTKIKKVGKKAFSGIKANAMIKVKNSKTLKEYKKLFKNKVPAKVTFKVGS